MKPETHRLAERTAAAILSGLENTRPLPARIVLAKYETQHDYETLRPEDKPALLKDHTALIEAIETKLATHLHMAGIKIETPVLIAAAYLRWLHKPTTNATTKI